MNNIIQGVAYGLPIMAIGLAIVFVALIILILAIMALSKIVRTIVEKDSSETKEAEAAPAPAPAPVVEPVVEAAEPVMDEEIIAVIAAAIAAFDPTGAKLVVRSVRRKGAWGKVSREEQVYRF